MDYGVPLDAVLGKDNSKKRQPRYKAILCPFHKETVPSCVVDSKLKKVYCFGCQKEYTLEETLERYEDIMGDIQDESGD
jgi:DNA primase